MVAVLCSITTAGSSRVPLRVISEPLSLRVTRLA